MEAIVIFNGATIYNKDFKENNSVEVNKEVVNRANCWLKENQKIYKILNRFVSTSQDFLVITIWYESKS